MRQRFDIAVIGGGPAGAAVATRAARGGARVVVFEKGPYGRDKVCGDGLTPRAVAALEELKIALDHAHRVDGLRMIAGRRVRELPWGSAERSDGHRFPAYGAVWPRRRFDAALVDAAIEAGADVRFDSDVESVIESDGHVTGVVTQACAVDAELVVLAAGPQGAVARQLGAVRDPNEPYGLAIRAYVESPRHADALIEACLTVKDEHDTWVPGYGWMFPCGDGTVNIGVGALSTMKGFNALNLNTLLESYRALVRDTWDIGPNLGRPRAWRLPMSAVRRHGQGWVAIGDAAGLINPMNGEGIDYALESGVLAADLFLSNPASAAVEYDKQIGARFDGFLRTGRRFAFLIGHPRLMRTGLRFALGTEAVAGITLQVMGNLVDSGTPGAAGRTLRAADRALALTDPVLRRARARA
jgi:geranylgeranyl reductase family protein